MTTEIQKLHQHWEAASITAATSLSSVRNDPRSVNRLNWTDLIGNLVMFSTLQTTYNRSDIQNYK